MAVLINDINLLRFCYAEVSGKLLDDLKDAFPSDSCVCFGEYNSDNSPWWAVVLYDFKENHDCLIDIALNNKGLFTPRTFARMAQVVFGYAFNQANLIRCTVQVRASNVKSLRLAKAWGFREEGYKRLGYKHPLPEDMHILGLLKEDCRWTGGKDGN